MLERWREGDVFDRSLANREGAEVWSFYEGPPTANGRPGSHHVLARVFKDVYPRYKTMCGYRVPRKAGWDCHGLPVELEVEKQLGIASKQEIEEFGIAEFNAALPRVGLRVRRGVEPADRADRLLDRPRRPLRHPRGRLHRVGLVVAAQALGRGPPLRGPQGRPLLPARRHPALLARGRAGLQGRRGPLHLRALPAARRGGRVAAGLDDDALDAARQRRRRGRPRGHLRAGRRRRRDADPGRAAGREGAGGGGRDRRPLLRRRSDRPPLRRSGLRARGRRTPATAYASVLAGDFVTTEDGTGLVHIAPAFGEDDYAVAAANGIFDPTQRQTLYNPVKPDGHFDDRVVGFEDRFVKDPEVTRELIADLDRRGLLFREQVYEHSYPHCWRCGTPLLYYATSSWYIAHLRGQGADARQQRGDRLAPRARQARPLRQMAREQRRLGALARPLLGHAAAGLALRRRRAAARSSASARSPSCASAPAARSPTTCTAPTSTR